MDQDIGDSTVDATEQAPNDSSTQQAVTDQVPARPQEGSEQASTDQPIEEQQQQQEQPQGQPSAVDDAAAPEEPPPGSSEQQQQQQPDSSTAAIPGVKQDAVELGTDGRSQAPDSRSRAAQLAQTRGAFSPADSSSAGGIPVRASTDAYVQQEQAGTGGWSGAQTAGLAVGIIVAGCVAGIAAMHYRRSRAPRSRMNAYSNEVEMRGLI